MHYFVPMNAGAKDVFKKTKYFLIPYLIILLACIIIKLLYTRSEIYFAVNSFYTDFLDLTEPYITYIGDGITIAIISALLLLVNFRASFLLITSYALSSLIAQVLKRGFDMPRPRLYFKDQLDKIHFVKGLYILALHSFPSGHTVTAFSAGVVATYLVKNKAWSSFFLFLALMVGYSRMYLSQHFFEDVLAGSVIGILITFIWITYIDQKKFINSPGWNRGLLSKKHVN
ncbi:phosphatase PAP2 family protein [Mucilaginibacter litoreus]|uniref:Phosphatase PAP2 family protein n=2 Tax=Mucilaginibacter litoreus TaxID=1048221 RepID=A0ABW3ARB1_9SPHI